ncbi:hypothetical protein SUTH_02844 [Sulfuritalea hydrogenivorans sk43H]|uniref:Caspase family p20 domain-containing protein n=1 Tax=Sulfuritalea hydrogenivorans sk43H TaxID=1223802 RepID=W0SLG5_9PROT|nr:hypothetical protein SUTH_02844 [Sulfuritalea hydrogenivorans sk43H]
MAVWLGNVTAAEPQRNLGIAPASAEKRVALVIGNATYKSGPLVNPVNDARAIANRLRSLGFDIVLRENLKQREIGGVYREFRSKITPGGVALFFYAGHGVQFKGQNYFPATDADISSEEDVPLQSLNLGNLLDNMDEAKAGVSLVFLDACRDNPFARRFRSTSRGLAKVEAASGTLIHYATRPGSVASDGEGKNGTYTEALLGQISEPGVPVELMLKRVANTVVAKTKGKQEPWVEGSLRGDFYFRSVAGAASGTEPPLSVPVDMTAVEISFWESIKNSSDVEDFQAYLDKYPNGQFVALAERRVKRKPARVDESTTTRLAPAVAGMTFLDCIECPEMVVIPSGSFEMGSNDYGNEKPIHRVQIGKPFALGKTEVTQGQWRSLMGSHSSQFSSCGDKCPVENVSWDDAQEYLRKLSQKTGKTYRLPSEAEWEFACRAGGTATYCGSDALDSAVWYVFNSNDTTRQVASKQANAWGLYDMSGNVSEWTQDCWNVNYNGAPSDGSPWMTGNCAMRVVRGGAWALLALYARPTNRMNLYTTSRGGHFGFRPARMLPDAGVDAAMTQPLLAQSTSPPIAPQVFKEWADSDNGADINWSEATHYCASQGSGWGLPTVAELENSYKTGQPTPCHKSTCKVSSKSRLTGLLFWSNESNGSSEVEGVSLMTGERSAVNVKYRINARALCVRRP